MTFAFTYMFLNQEIDNLFLKLHTFFQEFDKLHLGDTYMLLFQEVYDLRFYLHVS